MKFDPDKMLQHGTSDSGLYCLLTEYPMIVNEQ